MIGVELLVKIDCFDLVTDDAFLMFDDRHEDNVDLGHSISLSFETCNIFNDIVDDMEPELLKSDISFNSPNGLGLNIDENLHIRPCRTPLDTFDFILEN